MKHDPYHADNSHISSTGLKLIRENPYSYWEKYLNPNREPEEPTKALIEGNLVHTATLEPHLLNERYAGYPESIDRRTSKGKARYKKFIRENRGKQIVKQSQIDWARRAANAIHQKKAAKKLLSEVGETEKAHYFTHPETGSKCKVKPDRMNLRYKAMLDIKTTPDASYNGFRRSILKYGYDLSAAFYLDGYEIDTGVMPQEFIFIAVEKENPAPEKIALWRADTELIQLGREKYLEALYTYEECLATGEWPGYSEKIETISLPNYAFT